MLNIAAMAFPFMMPRTICAQKGANKIPTRLKIQNTRGRKK
jgi:hypothetical protein